MNEMNAIMAAEDLVDFLGNNPGLLACVHSVFPHAVNFLTLGDQLITLTNQDDITPMGLTVNSRENLAGRFTAGDQVVLAGGQIDLLDGKLSINLRNARVWVPGQPTNQVARPAEEIARLRLRLVRWLAKQPAEGLLPLLPRLTSWITDSQPPAGNIYSRYIAEDLEAFTNALNTRDWQLALRLADRLVGFGMGSTPSCDDFLAAYLLLFDIVDGLERDRFPWIREFNQKITDMAKNRTTLISANMLRHAAEGKTSISHQRLVYTCLFQNGDDLEKCASQVLRHGASSGGDFLLGLICALEWYQNTLTNTEKKGERAWVERNQPQPVPGI